MWYITGDIHGNIQRIESFSSKTSDPIIILGDCGFNYYGSKRDELLKEMASELPNTILCIKGNHEIHPDQLDFYNTKEWNGAEVFFEDKYPNILFAKDGEIYEIDGKKVFVIGGAYSVDKDYRIARGWKWFPSEQPSHETKMKCLKTLDKAGWKVDIVLSHTAPLKAEPRHLFLSFIDQRKVDKTTEEFLDEISDKLSFEKWYFGHYHGDWQTVIDGKHYEMLFEGIKEL